MKLIVKEKKKIKNFNDNIKYYSNANIDISKSVLAYGCSWEKNFPTFNIKYLYDKKYIFKYIKYYLIDIFKNSYNDFALKSPVYKKKIFNKLYITWGSLKNIKDKEYYCQFYKKNTLDKNTLWIVFLLDIPTKLPKSKNIIFFYNKKGNFSFIRSCNFLLKFILKNKLSLKNYLHYLSPYSLTADKFSSLTLPILKKYNFKKVEIVYEGQPFQNFFIKNFRKFSNAKIYGLCHAYQALPMHLIKKNFKKCDPDKLIVHQHDQKNSLIKFFNWKRDEILFKKRIINEKFKNCIYLPFSIEDSFHYHSEFKKFLEKFKYELYSYDCPKIKPHPAKKNNRSYKKFQIKIQKELENYSNFFSKQKKNKNFLLFFGPSSGIIRALNNGESVFQIFINSDTDIYKKIFWPNLKKKYITRLSVLYEKNNK